ncbi:hypothetical protein ElyMa_005034400 [Elysia marginata]|uniref:Uncharacterized protein n=1 Tax=Elysia marginata TaxID=1093978 RepID=A0AAV4JC72_9GAST|nr:hypothetical protein ElyMa_005034400 [Elysia marginata]
MVTHQSVNTKIKISTTSDVEKNVRHQTKRSSTTPRNSSAHQRSRYRKICCKTKIEMGWPLSKTSRQPLNPNSHQMAITKREKITRKTDAKMARGYSTVERNQLETRCQRERWQDSAESYILLWMNKAS